MRFTCIILQLEDRVYYFEPSATWIMQFTPQSLLKWQNLQLHNMVITELCNKLFLSSYFKKSPSPMKAEKVSLNVDWIYNNQHSWRVRTHAGTISTPQTPFLAKITTNPGVPLWMKWVRNYILMRPFTMQNRISWAFVLPAMRTT